MNQELATVIKLYTTGTHQELSNYLIGKSKDTIIGMLVDLLTMYINDKNSSTIREFITVVFAGYEHKEGKIGYNGFRQEISQPGKTIKCEAKPKNFSTDELEKFKNGIRKNPPSKLNGGGNFTDYTSARLKKDKMENLNMLVSGFIDGKLIYILEFPFNHKPFIDHLKEQLKKFESKLKKGEKTKGQFLRSASFDYKHFVSCPDLRVVYLLPKPELERYQPYLVKSFYEFLREKAR